MSIKTMIEYTKECLSRAIGALEQIERMLDEQREKKQDVAKSMD